MPDLVYGISSIERNRGDLPKLPVINMIAEPGTSEPNVALQSRPGIELSGITMGAGPVRGLFKLDGVLNNALFGVSATSLYSSGTLIGAIDGTGPVSFGGYEDRVFVNAGANIWQYDNPSLSTVAFPDDAEVSRITVGASRLIAIKKDTGEFFWSDALSDNIDALSFATAENSPDRLRDLLFIGDILILFGAETVEFWNPSDGDSAFAPLIGRVFSVGIRDSGCAVKLGSSFAWVTDQNRICVGEPDGVISDMSVQEALENSDTAALWTFFLDGEEFLALRTDTQTWTFGVRSRQWSQMESYAKDNWLPQCYADGYFGSAETGATFLFSNDHYDLEDVLERRFRAWASENEAAFVFNLTLRTAPGQTDLLMGLYSEPAVELRTSRDGGRTWGPWRSRSLGRMGKYRAQVRWFSLGEFGPPGVMVEIRVTDPVAFRVSGLTVNNKYGGI